MKKKTIVALAVIGIVGAGCAAMTISDEQAAAKALAALKASFKDRGQAKVDRLDQDETQRMCSRYEEKAAPQEVAERVEREQLALIKYPADGRYLGDWKEGEKIAQRGTGMQFSDDPAIASGANCYACHQLTKAELSFGTIGPPLYNFGKLRGFTPEMQKYAFGKVYNSAAFAACSNTTRPTSQHGMPSMRPISPAPSSFASTGR